MFQIIVLICTLAMTPSDCQTENALDVFLGPLVANEVMCGLHGQALVAQTALPARGPDEYVKIQCVRSSVAQQALRRRHEESTGAR
jgi:hypothetical protein